MSTIEVLFMIIIIFLCAGVLFSVIKVTKLKTDYTTLTKGVAKGNLEKLLNQHLKQVSDLSESVEDIQKEIIHLKNISTNYFNRAGFRRFNPFHETGGNQSFILVLLNENNDGFLISSLHQREMTRLYAKEIQKGESDHKLSDEEQKVLLETLKSHGKTN